VTVPADVAEDGVGYFSLLYEGSTLCANKATRAEVLAVLESWTRRDRMAGREPVVLEWTSGSGLDPVQVSP
jgi:hypothetical protein